jgi:hypothetical protein
VTAAAGDSTEDPAATDGLAWTGVTAVEEMLIAGLALFVLGIGVLVVVHRRRRNE